MSRVSRKSELSPSVTKAPNAIDLGKTSEVNMGGKTTPSVTSGGLGVTREITNVGGLSISGGVSVDISPIDLGINYDSSENSIGIAAGAEIPGGLLGVSGGVTIDLNTGEVTGGSIGGEALGLGVTISNSKEGGVGVGISLQIPFTPIEIEFELGFGLSPKEPTPTPTPTPTSTTPRADWTKPQLPPGDSSKYCNVCCLWDVEVTVNGRIDSSLTNKGNFTPVFDPSYSSTNPVSWEFTITQTNFPSNRIGSVRTNPGTITNLNYSGTNSSTNTVSVHSIERSDESEYYSHYFVGFIVSGRENLVYRYIEKAYTNITGSNQPVVTNKFYPNIAYSSCGYPPQPSPTPQPSPSPTPSPTPFPNPPPRKRNMNECCRDTLKMLREIRRFEQETMILLGRPLDSKGHLIPLPPNSKYFGEEIERIKTPIENIKDPEKEKIKFNNFYELQMYLLGQQINLDVGIDPQSFAAPSGMVQNPEYIRDSEKSLESNAQPQEDNFANKRQLEIGVDVKINSLSEQQQYIFEALKRLEYLFPYGELADAKFDKSLIVPGATGEIKVHNLIHFQEFFAQYLNATLGDPKIPVKIEDNNSLKEGKQEAVFRHFTIAQMIRELYKITLESGDDINAIMETGIRNFRTNLANRIQIVQIAEMTQALVEDTGMLESQDFIPLRLEGDPYAGKWKAGMGFEPDTDLDKNEEAATEKLMRATLNNFEAQVKVIRRDKRENSDIRDLLIQIAEMFIRSTAIPATKEGIEKALAVARFKTQVDMALTRSQVKRAAAASRSRTKKRKK